MKKLPMGISNFKEFKENNYYYVDKTKYIKKLVDEGKYYFIARPRRFGKSLFVDTLKEAFQGNKKLFKGLFDIFHIYFTLFGTGLPIFGNFSAKV